MISYDTEVILYGTVDKREKMIYIYSYPMIKRKISIKTKNKPPETLASYNTLKKEKGRFFYKKTNCLFCKTPIVIQIMDGKYKLYNLDSNKHNCNDLSDLHAMDSKHALRRSGQSWNTL